MIGIKGKQKIKDDDIRNALKLSMRVNNLAETSLPFVMKKLVKKANGQSLVVKYGKRSVILCMKEKNILLLILMVIHYQNKYCQCGIQQDQIWIALFMILDSIFQKMSNDLPEQILLCTQINKLSIKDMPLINEMKMKQRANTVLDIENRNRRLSYVYLSDKEVVVSSPSPRSISSGYMMDSRFD